MNQRVTEENGMEVSHDPKKPTQQISCLKGGLRTMPFIIVNESFERLASYGLMPNMILYLINEYQMGSARGTSILFLWSASSNFLGILGAFLSDSYLGRFRVIALGSISSLLGMILLWLTAMVPQAKPLPCSPSSNICESATAAQLILLFSSFGLMSIGAGCIRPCSIAFGADQLVKNKDDPKNERILQSFFNWYYASIGVSTILALTIVVYIQDQLGWQVGFGVPAILMFLSALFFFLGSSLYVKAEVGKSLFTRLVQVFVVALKNRQLAPPSSSSDGFYYHSKDSKLVVPTNKLRFLNKACIIPNPEEEFNPDELPSKPWELCTVDQVEEFKSLVRIIPIWSTGIIVYMTLTQSFTILQAKSMDRHITSNFQFPAASFTLFTILTLTIWVAFYDRILVPLLAKYTGQRRGISPIKRIGIGLLLSCMAMAVSAIVEIVRRRTAIEEGLSDDPTAVVDMSAMWLVPQHCLAGLAEAFNAVGQIEFFYSQLPKSMSSIAMALFLLGTGFSGLLGSLIVTVIDDVTSGGGKVSWVSRNPNKAHYDYYYWFLTILSFVNFLYFLVCCWTYGPGEEERSTDSDERDGVNKGLLSESGESPSTSSA